MSIKALATSSLISLQTNDIKLVNLSELPDKV